MTAIPPTYNGWSIGDNSVTAQVNSNDIVRVIGTGSALVTMDNVQKRLTINADNTTYNLTVENQQQPNRKSIRLTDNTGYAEEVILSAGTGVTLTRTNNRLEFSVAQDLSTSAVPTFTALNITGGVNATTYTGSGAQLEGLTGVPNGVYGTLQSFLLSLLILVVELQIFLQHQTQEQQVLVVLLLVVMIILFSIITTVDLLDQIRLSLNLFKVS